MIENDYTTTWVLPTGITLAEAQARPGQEFAFPQTLTTDPPCGVVIQQDVYNADPSAVTADGVLSWVDGRPEDASLYVSHVFYETPACPPLVCEPGFVPGWLDENGNAQGCVNNGNPPPTVTEVPVPPTTPTLTLAETGPDVTGMVVIALALVVVGGLLTRVKR